MRKQLIIAAGFFVTLLLSSCSPRDFLSRRLAGDLIAGSNTFKTPQQFQLHTGVVSNKDYLSPEYLVLQHHGWIAANNKLCPAGLVPPPCWDVLLTPSGVDVFRALVQPADSAKPSFTIPVARRELLVITGVTKQGNVADVDFSWRWIPSNEVGAALYSSDLHYKSTAAFREYDDGWRLVQSTPRSGQTLDDALQNAEPLP